MGEFHVGITSTQDRKSLHLLSPVTSNERLISKMEKPFITKLVNKIHDNCDICRHLKILTYLVTTPKGNMLNVCEACKNYALSNPDKLDQHHEREKPTD
jgi:hypothetical protein